MARKLSRYHDKNDDRFSSYLFLGLIITFLVLGFSFLLYNSLKTEVEYSDFTHIESYEEILTVNSSRYYVYYYSKNYQECQQIEKEIFMFAQDNDLGVKLYFVNAASVEGVNMISGMNTIPTLLIVEDGVVKFLTSSIDEITNMIIDE